MKDRYFYMNDIDATIIVEHLTRKELLSWLDEYCENVLNNIGYAKDDTYEILYKDGTFDYIDENYDGHKIKRTNIESIVNSNASSYMVYGKYEVNEYGVVTTSSIEKIDTSNIKEIDHYIA